MPRASLKKYDTYLKSIRAYCKASKLKLELRACAYDGLFIPSRSIVRVDPDLSETVKIAALLHELGHFMDYRISPNATWAEIEKAYVRCEEKHRDAKYKRIVVRTEMRAWDYGRVVAKILGIRLGKWYDRTMAECIKDYKS